MKNIAINLVLIFSAALLSFFSVFYFNFLVWIAFCPLIIIARNPSWKKLFLWGGFGSFVVAFSTVFWVVNYNKKLVFWGLLYIAGFYFLFIVLQRVLFKYIKPPFAILVPSFAWLSVFFLFSFNSVGNWWFNFARSEPRLGPVSQFLGEYGILFFILLVNSSVVFFVLRKKKIGYLIFLGVLILILGSLHFYAFNYKYQTGELVRVALIQGNFPETWNWRQDNAGKILNKYKELTWQAVGHNVDLVVWPEYAIPVDILADNSFYQEISTLANEANINLIIGAESYEKKEGEEDKRRDSVFLFDREGKEIGRYYAVKPFPFGYPPVTPGVEYPVFKTDVGKVAVTICYEEMFPQVYGEYKDRDVDFFVSLVNNGPAVYLPAIKKNKTFSELRAAVNNKYVLRSTNTGVTQVIAPNGFVKAEAPLNEEQILYADIYVK